MSIADELELLANTKEGLRVSLGLSNDVPFSQYVSHVPYYSKAGTVFDFANNQYSKDQLPVDLSDISEFIRLSSATMWQDGQLVEVANSIPRISGEGLLVEGQATNQALYSEDIGNKKWVPTGGATKEASSQTSPIAGATVYKVTSAQEHAPQQGIQNIVGTSSLFQGGIVSLLVKSAGVRYIQFNLASGTNNRLAIFDLIEGRVNPPAQNEDRGLSDIRPVGDGWFLCTYNGLYTTNALKLHFLNDFSGDFNGTKPYEGDGEKGVFVIGLSFLSNPLPHSSYIPTEGMAVTRAPDILNIPVKPTQTVKGDWDEGVTYETVDNEAVFTGHGYIRNITVEEL